MCTQVSQLFAEPVRRSPDGRLGRHTAGDCEFYGDFRYALARVGQIAVDAGALDPDARAQLVRDEELDGLP